MSSRKSEDPSEWMARVQKIQLSRITPEERVAMLARVERQRDVTRSCRAWESVELRSVNAVTTSFTALDAARRTAPAVLGTVRSDTMARERMDELERVDRLLANIDDVLPPAPVAVSTDVLLTTLEDLQKEPKTDEECASKFTVYEAFSAKVETIRKTLMEHVGTTVAQMPPAPCEAIMKQIADLDKPENLGIHDVSRFWFVHDMMRAATKNCGKMEAISKDVQTKLNLIASLLQAQCPICMESWDEEDVRPLTLSCCHQVCVPCWRQWVAVQGGHAFCPLCKHEEFVEFLSRM